MESNNQSFEGTELSYDAENRSFSGYGIVFNSDSVPMTIYDRSVGQVDVFEQITRQSLEGADMADVIAAINHDFSKILGRTASGTLELSVDDNGVKYRFDVPETSYGNDLLVSTRRGDFRGSSFTFSIDPKTGYDIEERADGSLVARPKQIRKIYEMGPVTNPAYEATTAENRSNALFVAAAEFLKARSEEQAKPETVSDDKMRDIQAKIRLSEEETAL
jgi:uncharacterized protein